MRISRGGVLDTLIVVVLLTAMAQLYVSRHPRPAPAEVDADFVFAAPVVVTRLPGAIQDTVKLEGLVFMFKTDCGACAIQKAYWRQLAKGALAKGVRVTGITAEPLTASILDYFGVPGMNVAQVHNMNEVALSLRTNVVPTTVFVAGRDVRFVGRGILDSAAKRRLDDVLSSEERAR